MFEEAQPAQLCHPLNLRAGAAAVFQAFQFHIHIQALAIYVFNSLIVPPVLWSKLTPPYHLSKPFPNHHHHHHHRIMTFLKAPYIENEEKKSWQKTNIDRRVKHV